MMAATETFLPTDAIRAPRGYLALREFTSMAWLHNPVSYGVGALILTLLGAGTTLIAPRILEPTAFGAFALLTSLFTYASSADLGLSQLADRRIAGRREGVADEAVAIMQARWIVGGLALLVLLPASVAATFLTETYISPVATALAVGGGVAAMIANGPITLFRAASKTWDFTFMAFILHAGMTAPRLAGLLLGGVTGCFAALALWYVACVVFLARPARSMRVRAPVLPILRAALPLFVFYACWLVFITINRWVSSFLSSPFELGLFSFGAALATIGLSLLGTFSQLRYPRLLTRIREAAPSQASSLTEREVVMLSLVVIAIALVAQFLTRPFVHLAFPGYEAAVPSTIVLAVACVPLGVLAWTMPMVIMRSARPIRDAAVVFGPAFAVLVMAMTLGQRLAGIEGQAWGFVGASFLLFASTCLLMCTLGMLKAVAALRVIGLQAAAIGLLVAMSFMLPQHARSAGMNAMLAEATDWPVVFHDDFDTLDLRYGATGVWQPHYPWGERTNASNEELQYYVDPRPGMDVEAVQALTPFRIADGKLEIRASEVPAAVLSATDGQPYASGLLTTTDRFSFTYGLVEIRAKMPKGRGLWPAFWLLPEDRTWPPELDVFEVLGDDTHGLHVTVHSGIDIPQGARSAQSGQRVSSPDLSRDFHLFAALWTPQRIVWFLDGNPVHEAATPDDMHKPMFLLVNLAVGGTWPGAPDAATRFPNALVVDRITVRQMPAAHRDVSAP